MIYPLSQKSKIFASSPIGRAKGAININLFFLSLVIRKHVIVALDLAVVEFALLIRPFSKVMLKLRFGGDDAVRILIEVQLLSCCK